MNDAKKANENIGAGEPRANNQNAANPPPAAPAIPPAELVVDAPLQAPIGAVPVAPAGQGANAVNAANIPPAGGGEGPKRARDGQWYEWLEYERGEKDTNGNVITCIHARSDEFVIYFCGPEKAVDLYYECTDGLLETTAVPNSYLARINMILPSGGAKRREILECVADAFEMWLCNQQEESRAILKDLLANMEGSREAVGRLNYVGATLIAAVGVWILYLLNYSAPNIKWLTHPDVGKFCDKLAPWLLAAALASTGGFFSVCLKLASIKVNVSQSLKWLYFAGGTRAAIALIAGVACLLAINGKIVLALATGESQAAALTAATLFFLFLAGFSETFIPNVLRDAESNTANRGGKPANGPEGQDGQQGQQG